LRNLLPDYVDNKRKIAVFSRVPTEISSIIKRSQRGS